MSNEANATSHNVIPFPPIESPSTTEQPQVAEDYLASPSWSSGTRKEYRRELDAFRAHLGNELLQATRKDVEGYLKARLDGGTSKATVARSLAAIRGFYRYASEEGVIALNPAASVRAPKVPTESPRLGLSRTEAQTLLSTPDPSTTVGARDRALLMLLLSNALRITEALELHVEDLSEVKGQKVAMVIGKGDKPATVPLAAQTWTAITTWLEVSGIEEGFVFRSVTKAGDVGVTRMSARGAAYRIQWLAKKADIGKRISPHSLRHTAVTLALEAGQPLHLVQDMARHADPRTTRRYDRAQKSLNNPVPHVLVAALTED